MENASKALIIAGAILIAILLITIGINVMDSINDPMDQAKDSSQSQAQQIFNAPFTGYLGEKQKASSVKALMTAIASSNGTNPDHQVKVFNGDKLPSTCPASGDVQPGEVQASVNNQKTYKVQALYEKGYITAIYVKY